MSVDEAAVQKLLDRAAITDLILGYARAVDRRDWAKVLACFAPDAYVDYGRFQGSAEEVFGSIRKAFKLFEHTMHFMEPRIIEIVGDEATSETYGIAYHRRVHEGKPKDLVVGMRYSDELVRQDGAWQFRRRTLEYIFERDDAVVVPGLTGKKQ